MSLNAHQRAEAAALDAAALKGTDTTYPLLSLHALQMRPHTGGEWQQCPTRLFLQERDGAWIVALCGTTSRLFHTSAYDHYSFKLGERGFVDRHQLLAFFRQQRQSVLRTLDQTGAVLLRLTGEVEAVALELGPVLSTEQMQDAVQGDIDIHTWAGEHDAHNLTGTCLVMDAEGKFYGKSINALATCLWYQVYPLGRYSSGRPGAADVIVGDVLLVKEAALSTGE
jgi:hypothetical protein